MYPSFFFVEKEISISIPNTYFILDTFQTTMVLFRFIMHISRSAHRTPNFMNPECQFPQFKVLQSVFSF